MKKKTKQNQIIKVYQEKEAGVTLVALIVTIIVLVIISAVSIMVVYNSRIVEYAVNGTKDYASEGINENKVLEGTESLIDSTVNMINDIVGRKIEGGSEPEESKPEEPTPPPRLTKEELSQDIMIGKYVDYKPQGEDYIVDGTYSGTGTNQTFTRNDDMKWRIWGVEENKLLLISETLGGNIQLEGANGYNNGVKILNDGCSTAFGNSTYGSAINVRSINQDDIDKVTNMTEDIQRKAVYSYYGTTYSISYPRPNIYEQELEKTGGGTLDRSVQYNNSWVIGTTKSSCTVKYTGYLYNITNYVTQTMYDTLLTNMAVDSMEATDSHIAYWVASRMAGPGKSWANFGLFFVESGSVSFHTMYRSDTSLRVEHSIRPFIEINLDSIAIGGTGSGTASSPYSMALK